MSTTAENAKRFAEMRGRLARGERVDINLSEGQYLALRNDRESISRIRIFVPGKLSLSSMDAPITKEAISELRLALDALEAVLEARRTMPPKALAAAAPIPED